MFIKSICVRPPAIVFFFVIKSMCDCLFWQIDSCLLSCQLLFLLVQFAPECTCAGRCCVENALSHTHHAGTLIQSSGQKATLWNLTSTHSWRCALFFRKLAVNEIWIAALRHRNFPGAPIHRRVHYSSSSLTFSLPYPHSMNGQYAARAAHKNPRALSFFAPRNGPLCWVCAGPW